MIDAFGHHSSYVTYVIGNKTILIQIALRFKMITWGFIDSIEYYSMGFMYSVECHSLRFIDTKPTKTCLSDAFPLQ